MRIFGRSTRTLLTATALAVSVPVVAQQAQQAQQAHEAQPAALSPEVIALACSATLVDEPPAPSLLITGGQDSFRRVSYGRGDLITINAGTDNGIEVGQEFFVRRLQPGRTRASRTNPTPLRTTGWVRVYAVDKTMSLVTVSHTCDTIDVGDFLEPFVLPTLPQPDADPPKAQRDNYGHILIGVDRRTMFSRDDLFIVDRGSNQGVTPGARFLIYRDKRLREAANKASGRQLAPNIVPDFLFELGEAVAVDVKPDMATLRAMTSHDAFSAGDYVALRK